MAQCKNEMSPCQPLLSTSLTSMEFKKNRRFNCEMKNHPLTNTLVDIFSIRVLVNILSVQTARIQSS